MPILTDEERVGTEVGGRYRLEAIVGRGGMGTVFAGRHTRTGRPVAVKLLRAEYASDRSGLRRFFQEARAAAELNHPNVVDVLDVGELDDGGAFLVLELLRGVSLAQRLEQRGVLPADEALAAVLPALRALAAAHARGVVHRDIKPDNVFLHRAEAGGAEVPKLLDFGVAKVLDASRSAATVEGSVIGTPHYMAPEQAEGRSDVSHAADIWSVGVLLFECLTGELPFTAATPTGVLVAILTRRPPRVCAVNPSVPEELGAVLDRALAFAPAERWPSVAALHNALLRVAVARYGFDASAALPCDPSAERAAVLPRDSVSHAALAPTLDHDALAGTVAQATPRAFEVSRGHALPPRRRDGRLAVALVVGVAAALLVASASVAYVRRGAAPVPVVHVLANSEARGPDVTAHRGDEAIAAASSASASAPGPSAAAPSPAAPSARALVAAPPASARVASRARAAPASAAIPAPAARAEETPAPARTGRAGLLREW